MSSVYRSAAQQRTRASSLGAIRALVQLACSFISVKLTAVYLGPSGLALIAQFNNFMSLGQSVVGTGLDTASGRLTAEYSQDAERRKRLLGTIGRLGLMLGLPTAAAIAIGSPWLAEWLLHDRAYAWVFVLGALSVLASILNSILLGALSARGGITRVVISNIIASILGVSIYAPASIRWGVTGGLGASATVYIFSVLVTLVLIRKSPLVGLRDLAGSFDGVEARRIAGFYPMLIVHAVMTPLSLLLIRDHVANALSLEAAGLWQACWRLSETYLMIVTMSVTTQFMVRLGEASRSPERLRAEMLKTLSHAVGATAALALAIYLLREQIVRFLFSHTFLPVADLMPTQLLGDLFKITGFICGFVLVATMRSHWYIATQIVVPMVFIVLASLLGARMGVPGVTLAYVVSGVVHCVIAFIALRDLIFLKRPAHAS
ncbi:MAG: O-antigen translocase [Ideonella sp.]|nr:O-antigen translocase [Ideonella sp.]MCC7459364.1 O-antigen translocase [Nitrospira sp.]